MSSKPTVPFSSCLLTGHSTSLFSILHTPPPPPLLTPTSPQTRPPCPPPPLPLSSPQFYSRALRTPVAQCAHTAHQQMDILDHEHLRFWRPGVQKDSELVKLKKKKKLGKIVMKILTFHQGLLKFFLRHLLRLPVNPVGVKQGQTMEGKRQK